MVKKVNIGNARLYFVFKPIPKTYLTNLKSQIEINLTELINGIKDCNYPRAHFICEGGWYFNNPIKISQLLQDYKIYYFVLNPPIRQLRKNYLTRSPEL